MYAILDIETTGGQYNEEGITEIAIYKFDGHEVVDQFISLVNPEKAIQPFVVKLTGINNAMLSSAPKFYEIAKRIIEITDDCIIVAHNAQFDYRILRTEFTRLGYDYQRKNLCTVELSKKLIPDQVSYSLGKLVRALGIPMADRHRATGDAMATVKLFKMLLAKDLEKEIVKSFVKTEIEKGLTPKLLDIVSKLPSTTGIYYIHKENGDLIYIGKSRNIKKRVNQHFTGSSSKSKKIQLEVFDVTYEETGSELIALLKEAEEIKINKPKYNRSLKKTIFPWSLYQEKDLNGYIALRIQKTDARKKELASFSSPAEAQSVLFKITDSYQLCQKINGLETVKSHCFPYELNQCNGACIQKESSEEYNIRVESFFENNEYQKQNMIIIDRGRNIQERSAILIEDGIFKGYAFFDLNYQVNNIDILKNIIIPMKSNRDSKNIILSYLKKKKVLKTLSF
ncbi:MULTISPECIES: exonuclease domain-containing protein [Flavobacterium]|uniref:DNA polymerase-3 subunit epsilon n=1 Tax=Flavobacterium lindanitolerans TaxID=428988 RepID=A0A497V0A7_9FLAO|nr:MULTISPECIES: exonuclease domain-containing protein [Flavobacterium]MBU7571123.1 GIY-YIG nuclease family protein [Flavobacterium sp.]PZO32906.1 MAG: exonuclease [Flavobacteriaceae bacterium]PZQ87563.1 MAG: exonuclease [Flavobacterium johnsoniae]KQS53347.1 exonuclease [Flavobacterium sp. Leaf359]PKW21008.1 DNA polymerase-3 subunit epsilon [Flavobacterium lindanitolerans]